MLLPYADAIDASLKVVAIWISASTIGAMIGVFLAVASRKPLRTIELWGFLGGAMGTAFGFSLMICAFAALVR